MDLFNVLPDVESQAIDDFLAYIPIYNSKRRTTSYQKLLRKNLPLIEGQVCCEAGAGGGVFSREMARLGAKKVYAVERSAAMFEVLKQNTAGIPNLDCIQEYIEDFEPDERIDLLLHEFYGPLVMDESILALQALPFEPGTILPDGGRLWAMPLSETEILSKDKLYTPSWKQALKGALVSDLFDWSRFRKDWLVFDWNLGSEQTRFEFELPEACDFIALCGEITHQGKPVLNMAWTHNWSQVFTPVHGTRFELGFDYLGGYTDVFFKWLE